MIKKMYGLAARFLCVGMLCMGFTACGNDDDDVDEPDVPVINNPVAHETCRIQVDDPSAPFNILELTTVGRYFMYENNTPVFAPAKQTRATSGPSKTGSFSKNSDGSYTLQGFGSVTFLDDNGKIEVNVNGESQTYDFSYLGTVGEGKYDCSKFLNEWTMNEVYFRMSAGGESIEKSFPNIDEMERWMESLDDDDDPEYIPGKIVRRAMAKKTRGFDHAETRMEDLIISGFGFVFPKMYWYNDNGAIITYDYGFAAIPWRATGKNKGQMIFSDYNDDYYWDGGLAEYLDMSIEKSRFALTQEINDYDEETGGITGMLRYYYVVK